MNAYFFLEIESNVLLVVVGLIQGLYVGTNLGQNCLPPSDIYTYMKREYFDSGGERCIPDMDLLDVKSFYPIVWTSCILSLLSEKTIMRNTFAS